ncbi:MAG: RDD family protein [Thermoleophilia bacterium]|nr:RDD family protein [Thermoleophilia bacterium]
MVGVAAQVEAQPDAPLASRKAATFLDVSLAGNLFLAPWIAFDIASGATGEDWYWISYILAYFFVITIPVLLMFAWFVTFLALYVPARLSGGRSLGKAIFGLATVAADGGPARGWQLRRREARRAWRIALVFPALRDLGRADRVEHRRAMYEAASQTRVVPAPRSVSTIARAAAGAVMAFAIASSLGFGLGVWAS